VTAGGFPPRQEDDVLPGRRLSSVAGALVAITLASIATAWLVLHAGLHDDGALRPPARAPAEIGHVEQSLVESARRGLDAREEQREALTHYAWVDRARGVARIPIDRAIELTVERSR
jgi:hypothetical protein